MRERPSSGRSSFHIQGMRQLSRVKNTIESSDRPIKNNQCPGNFDNHANGGGLTEFPNCRSERVPSSGHVERDSYPLSLKKTNLRSSIQSSSTEKHSSLLLLCEAISPFKTKRDRQKALIARSSPEQQVTNTMAV
jgi:hypothetical protein